MAATATITEEQAARINELARRLCVVLRVLTDDVASVVTVMPIKLLKDLHELESIPTLLGLATEGADELLDLSKTIEAEF